MESKNGADGAIAEGNTIPPSRLNQAKRWCFTLNNYEVEQCDQLVINFEMKSYNYVFEEEVGDQGTPHLQGYVECPSRTRPSAFGLPFRWSLANWRVAKGSRMDNWNYCTKEGTGIRTNMRDLIGAENPFKKITFDELFLGQRYLCDQYREPENALFGRQVHVYVDVCGGWGKTITTKYMIDQMNAIVVAGKTADAAYAIAKRIENEEPIPIVVFDIPRGGKRVINWHAVEKIKDGCLFATKYESGMLRFNSPHVVVFTNEWPDLTRLSADRWVVRDLNYEPVFRREEQPTLEEVWCEESKGEEKKE